MAAGTTTGTTPPPRSHPDDGGRRSGPQDRESWLGAALAVLVADGIDAVHITRLARRLGITRGSFYWHFRDRDDLLAAMLASWQRRNTGVMLDALAGATGITDGLLRLFAVWVDHQMFDPALDQAIRDWGRRVPAVHDAVAAEDDSRVAAITDFFRRHGYGDPEAFVRARVLYFTQVTFHALAIDRQETLPDRLALLPAYHLCFTGRDLDATAAADHCRMMLARWPGGPDAIPGAPPDQPGAGMPGHPTGETIT